MKKSHSVSAALAVLILIFCAGCLKDSVSRTYTYTLYRPVYKTTAEVRANIKSNASVAVRQPGKLFIKGDYIFLNELDKGVHIIDNHNPAQPKNVAFIDIPGNLDLAVKGNTLYADLYTDLVAIDIANPLAAKVTHIVEDVFPHRSWSSYYPIDSTMIVNSWVVKDTTVTEEYTTGTWQRVNGGWGMMFERPSVANDAFASAVGGKSSSSPAGVSGSMARFTIVEDRLYTVGDQELTVFNIADAKTPKYITENQISFGIETIFPFKDKLFIGSTAGMFIYSISNPDRPQQLSRFTHVQSCDPVIADDDHAYVTLRSGNFCQGFTNQLEVINISRLLHPSLVKTYPMTNPYGLSKDGDLLFICDGADGLKLYNAAKPDRLQLLQTISGLETYDVIAYGGLALVVAKDGLYQFDYSNRNNIKQISKIALAK